MKCMRKNRTRQGKIFWHQDKPPVRLGGEWECLSTRDHPTPWRWYPDRKPRMYSKRYLRRHKIKEEK